MDVNGVGWLTAIIVGGLAGWIAEKAMKSQMGLFANIILGIVGAVVLNAILAALDVTLGVGWIAYLITGVLGACLLIFVARMVRGSRA
ncbi:GlsB/YeaQ/YmgE family stress response membrane protein [Acuticoccus kandeliae]|uniref:GlsB/YeaQ/YmgE family stress response membrane protein n=1 Tax=Acuticoccus kandeliae TaxID=2073160 RepID=UPI000D3E0415|nr:GlsB/YeaQ/YmgE family stress response membrane protein [Acuticoccus kandeliae]